jgi:hypothetical protein
MARESSEQTGSEPGFRTWPLVMTTEARDALVPVKKICLNAQKRIHLPPTRCLAMEVAKAQL